MNLKFLSFFKMNLSMFRSVSPLRKRGRYARLICSIVSLSLSHFAAGAIAVDNLRCEYLTDPLGIDQATPRLSWMTNSLERGEK